MTFSSESSHLPIELEGLNLLFLAQLRWQIIQDAVEPGCCAITPLAAYDKSLYEDWDHALPTHFTLIAAGRVS